LTRWHKNREVFHRSIKTDFFIAVPTLHMLPSA